MSFFPLFPWCRCLVVGLAMAAPSVRAALTPAQLAEVLDSGTSITWAAPLAAWTLVTGPEFTHDGVDGIRTPTLGNRASADLTGRVAGPGVLRGQVRISSEPWQDMLQLAVDGVVVREWSGERREAFEAVIPRGAHEVKLSWVKDGDRMGGADAAWLDEVIFSSTVVPVEEALDVAGTPAAGAVVFSTPAGSAPWIGVPTAEGEAGRGGDLLFSTSLGSSTQQLLATVAGPAVVTFRGRFAGTVASNYQDALWISPQGAAQVLDQVTAGEWTVWRVLVSGSSGGILLDHGGRGNSGRSLERGYVLDDWSVSALAPVEVAQALDAPGMIFTTEWNYVNGGPAQNAPWLAVAGGAEPGFHGDGVDGLITPRAVISGYDYGSSSTRKLTTRVTGPGRLSFWWKRLAPLVSSSFTAAITVRDPARTDAPREVHLPTPGAAEWQQQVIEVPPGARDISWTYTAVTEVLAMDQVEWVPALPVVPPPSPSEAVELSGPITWLATGSWDVAGWSQAGSGDGDALMWSPDAHPDIPDGPGRRLVAATEGGGWLSFAWQAGSYDTLGFEVNGAGAALGSGLTASGAPRGPQAWWKVARYLPPGNHVLAWAPVITPYTTGGGQARLDGLSLQAAAPAWVEALEGSGITDWQMGGNPWPVVTAGSAHDGVDALRSPGLGANDSAGMGVQVAGPGTLRFWWKVGDPAPLPDISGTPQRNTFSLTTGGNDVPSLKLGVVGDWVQGSVELPQARTYPVTWRFQRSDRATLPGDGAWLDQVSFAPAMLTTVAEAMDAPGLTWTSSGAVQSLTGGGLGAAMGSDLVRIPQDLGFPPVPAWIQTTVPGPGLVTVRVGNGQSAFRMDGAIVPVSYEEGRLSFQIRGAGPHVCRLEFSSRYADFDLDDFQFTPLNLTTVEAALDEPNVIRMNLNALPSRNYGWADAAASHDGVDVLRMQAVSVPSNASNPSVTARFNGPALVRFWWRGEGSAEGIAFASLPTGSENRTGSFPWEEKRFLLTTPGEQELGISARAAGAVPYQLWVDQLRIEPLVAAPLAEALHAGGLTFTAGGSATWQGLRPPGAPAGGAPDDGAYALVNIPSTLALPAWLETTVTGPGFLSYTAPDRLNQVELAVTRQASGGAVVNVTTGSPVLIPPGPHTVRWAVRHQSVPAYSVPSPTMQLRDVAFVPALSLAEGLDQLEIPFTAVPGTGGFWYGSQKNAQDTAPFSGSDVVQLNGTADLSFPITGPGWLTYEAGFPAMKSYGFWPPETKIALHLLPAPPAAVPDPWPSPLAGMIYYAGSSGQLRREKVRIPPGFWQAVFRGVNAGTLNQLAYTPIPPPLTVSAAAEALDLTADITLSLPSGVTELAPVSREGGDALQVVISNYDLSPEPLVTLSLEGPALLTGWLRTAKARPDNSDEVLGVASDPSFEEVRVFLDGAPVAIAWASPQDDGWVPLRLPITSDGAHTVTFAMARPSSGNHHLLQLDGFSRNTLTPVLLADALDTPELAWTTGGPATWQGFASPLASPDAVDAAWITVPVAGAEDPLSWLETTVTGPGSLTITAHGGGAVVVTQGSKSAGVVVNSHGQTSGDNWQTTRFLIEPGPQTIRLAARPVTGSASIFGVDQVDWQPGSVTTLAEALDAPGLTLITTGPEAASWQGLAIPLLANDGADALFFRTKPTQLNALETTVQGPALVSFRSSVGYGVVTTFTVDGQPVRAVGSSTGGGVISVGGAAAAAPPPLPPETDPFPQPYYYWQREEFVLPAASHVLRWTLAPSEAASPWPNASLLALDELRILPLSGGPSLAEAIDQPGWSVTTNRPDKVRSLALTADAYHAEDAVLLTGDPDDTFTYPQENRPVLTAVVPGPGILRYRWRNHGSSYRGPNLTSPGGAIAASTGSSPVPWTEGWIVLPYQGPSLVVWRVYGLNHGYWVDAVTFEPAPPPGPATGAPGLAWTTGGTTPWIGIPALLNGYPNLLPQASVAASGPSDSWLETTLTGPGRLKFTAELTRPWNVSGVISFDGQAMQGVEWVQSNSPGKDFTLIVPPGPHTVRWALRSGSAPLPAPGVPAVLSLRGVSYVPGTAVDPIAEALDAPALPWLIPGNAAGWQLQTASTTDGVDALRFTPPDLYSNSSLTTVLPEPSTVSVKVRAQGNRTLSVFPVTAQPAWSDIPIRFDAPQPQIVILPVSSTYNSTEPPLVELDQLRYTPVPVSLGDALDAPGQVWETSSGTPFIGYATSSRGAAYDEVDAVMARGGQAGAWLRTTVSGPARVSFRQYQTGGTFTLDGAALPTPQSTGWNQVNFETGPGLHELRWEKSANELWAIDTFSAVPLAPGTSLAEALDFPGPWLISGPARPEVFLTDSSDGQDAVLSSGFTGWLGVEVTGPGRLEFHNKGPWTANHPLSPLPLLEAGRRISRPGPPGGWLNESELSRWPGIHPISWTRQVIGTIPPGRQFLQWPTGFSYSEFGERLGLDQVSFVPYAGSSLAEGLDAPALAFTSGGDGNAASPWSGWQAGSAAYDGQDVVISGATPESWMDVTVPAGAGEVRLMARCPSRTRNGGPLLTLRQGDANLTFPVPAYWKQIVLPVSAAGPRTLRLGQTPSGDIWLDALTYVPATETFDQWLADHGLPAGTLTDSDGDGDGIPLVLEYAFGLDASRPGQPDLGVPAEAGLPVFELVDRYNFWPPSRLIQCRYLRRTGGRGLQYEVLFANDPVAPLDDAARGDVTWITPLTNDWELVTVNDYSIPNDQRPGKRFGRVRVTLQR